MKPLLEDIRDKIARGVYRNEEHVRVCIVLRILDALGWNIWNPSEVNLEFPVLPNEDQTRIDVALFLSPHEPSVFIEVKAIGKLEGALSQAERQLRDYNRDNQALFSIITDGQTWRLYHSAARGEFANRCFKILNLTENNLEDLEQGFAAFLSKAAVETGNSEREATTYLQLSREQRAMEDALPEARRLVLESPYPSLPEALVQVVARNGVSISLDKATKFIQRSPSPKPPVEQARPVPQSQGVHKHERRTRGGTLPPDGTLCRFTYKNQEYRGRIEKGEMVIDGVGEFTAVSAASGAVAHGTCRDGWRDWYFQLPGTSTWILADTWRNKDRQ